MGSIVTQIGTGKEIDFGSLVKVSCGIGFESFRDVHYEEVKVMERTVELGVDMVF